MNFNPEMLKGLVERFVYLLVPLLVAKGWIPEDLRGPATDLIIYALLFGGAIVLGIKLNTQASLVTAAVRTTEAKEIVIPNKETAKSVDEATPSDVKVSTK